MSKQQDREIEALIKLFEDSDWQELSLRANDLRLFLSKDAQAGGLSVKARTDCDAETSSEVSQDTPETGPEPAKLQTEREGLVAIRAANVGTFYRAPKPGEPSYVEVGDQVSPETEVCLVEVMKLFTPQQAGVAGTIREVCIEDAQMVEYDQPLFYVEPASE